MTCLIFPDVCSFCGSNIDETADIDAVCRFCAAQLPLRPFPDLYERCVEDRLLLRLGYRIHDNFPVIVACRYEDAIKKSLLDMKFYEAAYYKEVFGSILALAVGLTGKLFDCIIPIPLHEKRVKERGYNQAYLIACKLSSSTGIPVMNDCLVRNRYTERQSETKNREQRIDNLTGVFRCIRPDAIAGKKILILDDILTSGATLFNAARALREAVGEEGAGNCNNGRLLDVTGITLASER